MTTDAKSLFDEKLLSRWQDGGAPAMTQHGRGRADAACRPGYGLFKLMLAFSLFSGIFALLPWSLAKAGEPLGLAAGGYVYVSIPLHAAQPDLDAASLRVDLRGAGMNVLRFEMAQPEGTASVTFGDRQPTDWRRTDESVRADNAGAPRFHRSATRHRTRTKRAPARSASAGTRYLALLGAYHREPSRAERRKLYPDLVTAYRRATAAN